MIRFSLFGIPVQVQPIFWLLVAFLGGGMRFLTNPTSDGFAYMVIFMLAAFISILIHELGHASVGLAKGAPRAEIHLHGMGGYAQFPAANFSRKNRFLMIAAGPGASIALCVISVLVANFLVGPPQSEIGLYGAVFIEVMITINIVWTVLNLMPALPLDGGQMVATILGQERLRLTCIISFVTVGILAIALWVMTQSFFNLIVMALLASHTLQVWKSLPKADY